jgi:hypothetical protein
MEGQKRPRLRIRNWREYQHYKTRNPPWAKLHREILDSEDWVAWDDASKVLAIVCMVLATRDKTLRGEFTSDLTYLRKVAHLDYEPDLKPLLDSGFIVYVKNASSETETETETETEHPQTPKRKARHVKPESYVEPENSARKLACGTSSNQNPKPPKSKHDKLGITRFATATGFDDWWTIWENPSNKLDAMRAWCFDLTDPDRAEMVARTQGYQQRREDRIRAGGWVPRLPAGGTFLRNERWNDQFPEDPEAKTRRKPGGFDPTVGAHDENAGRGYGWHPDDVKQFSDHPEWPTYMSDHEGPDGYLAETWERFEPWLAKLQAPDAGAAHREPWDEKADGDA